MSPPVSFILSLAGSLCAGIALASGEPFRREGRPLLQRYHPRMVLALVLLSLSLAGGVADALSLPERAPTVVWITLATLLLGIAATLWAFLAGPGEGATPTARLTPRGKLALVLLTVAQALTYAGGEASDLFQQTLARATPSILGLLSLLLVCAATGAAAATFRASSPLYPGPGPWMKRISPLARGTLLLLGMAALVLGLAVWLIPGPTATYSLFLVLLGAASGILSYTADRRTPPSDEVAPYGISPRRWVSLALLGLAGVSLGSEQLGLATAPPVTPSSEARAADEGQAPGGANAADPNDRWSKFPKIIVPFEPSKADPTPDDEVAPTKKHHPRL